MYVLRASQSAECNLAAAAFLPARLPPPSSTPCMHSCPPGRRRSCSRCSCVRTRQITDSRRTSRRRQQWVDLRCPPQVRWTPRVRAQGAHWSCTVAPPRALSKRGGGGKPARAAAQGGGAPAPAPPRARARRLAARAAAQLPGPLRAAHGGPRPRPPCSPARPPPCSARRTSSASSLLGPRAAPHRRSSAFRDQVRDVSTDTHAGQGGVLGRQAAAECEGVRK